MITLSSNPFFFTFLIVGTLLFVGATLWVVHDLEKDSKPRKKIHKTKKA